MYDYDELRRAWLKFLNEFDLDTFAGPGLVLPGKMLDSIDYKLHHWPGMALLITFRYTSILRVNI